MVIREAYPEDAQSIKDLHDRSVLVLCRSHYTSDQIEEWVKFSPLEKYRERLLFQRTFVAEIDGRIIGYVRWNPATGELCSIFIHPDHTRQGIATQLMKKAYQDVHAAGQNNLWLYASLNAVPFYRKEGWTYVEQVMRGSLACVRMEKVLSDDKI
jgi:putative acetyltransferase